jgi:hypothetical protein
MTSQRIAPSAAVMLCAIVAAGSAAGAQLAPVMWLYTAVVAGVVIHGIVRDNHSTALPAGLDISELPPTLREHVRSAFAQLPEGDARRLLLGVVNQARLQFGRGDSRFDAGEERQLAAHVVGLVDACCATAIDLARVDLFTGDPNAAAASLSAELTGRATKARGLFRDRLTNAAAALAELYTANVERGTPSTDRVAELTAEISADASARAAASSEMAKLFGGESS